MFYITVYTAEVRLDADKETKEFHEEKVIDLIEKWISCSIETDNEELNELVKEVNVHKHTKSCMKRGNGCRFKFPRMPSEETIIAKPLDDSLEEDEGVGWTLQDPV